MNKILIIQTAFIGDVILATPLIEQLKLHNPNYKIDFLLRKGNEALLVQHPHINEILIWDKKKDKKKGLWLIAKAVRKKRYDVILNLQRFLSSGLLATYSNAKKIIGFDKNPLSFMYHEALPHQIGNKKSTEYTHEIERNLSLLKPLQINFSVKRPVLYPSLKDVEKVKPLQNEPYICIAPTSVWFTKQFPSKKWIAFINKLTFNGKIYLLGAPSDKDACDKIANNTRFTKIENLAGKLSLLQSAALLKNAIINYVNDSAPMHLASAVNAPVCAIYCSTIPAFGFGPLSDFAEIVQIQEDLACRPCGLHGFKTCPKSHFNCAEKIQIQQLIEVFEKASLAS